VKALPDKHYIDFIKTTLRQGK